MSLRNLIASFRACRSTVRIISLELELVSLHLAPAKERATKLVDQAYVDKLDGRISEEFWVRKSSEWQTEEQTIQNSLLALQAAGPERLLDAARILELANKAYFLYVKQPPEEKAKLLKLVLSNCAIDAVSVYPTYRKPLT